MLLTRTVSVNKEILTGTVPVNKELLTRRVPVNNLFLRYNLVIHTKFFLLFLHFAFDISHLRVLEELELLVSCVDTHSHISLLRFKTFPRYTTAITLPVYPNT